jgi:hypothetical protein
MNALDAELVRDIRREVGKRPINATRLDIEVVNGRVFLGGMVTPMRSQPDAILKDEMHAIEKIFIRDRRVKALSSTVRVIQEAEEHETHDSRGRMRNH